MVSTDWVSNNFPSLSKVDEIAEGGQKWVFGATHAAYGDVVVKIIKPDIDGQRVAREILAVAKANSPRVPKVFESGSVSETQGGQDLVWIIEQRVRGETVRTYIAKVGQLSLLEVLKLGIQVLESLVYAADASVVHRDVKPDNILRDESGNFWLLDFGIARHLDMAALTKTSLGGPGTIGYAPPEQYRGIKKDIDSRADLFALAVTMIECLTGQHPFWHEARDAQEVIRRIESTTIQSPVIDEVINKSFNDFIVCMAHPRVDCRPPDVREALEWLNEMYLAVNK